MSVAALLHCEAMGRVLHSTILTWTRTDSKTMRRCLLRMYMLPLAATEALLSVAEQLRAFRFQWYQLHRWLSRPDSQHLSRRTSSNATSFLVRVTATVSTSSAFPFRTSGGALHR